MSTSIRRETAKIYQFPRRNAGFDDAQRVGAALVEPRWQPALGVECGSGWYHAAAIDESRRDRK